MFGKNFFNWPDAIIESNPKYICKGTSDNSDLENEKQFRSKQVTQWRPDSWSCPEFHDSWTMRLIVLGFFYR